MIKKCEYCESKYESVHGAQKYCTPTCSRKQFETSPKGKAVRERYRVKNKTRLAKKHKEWLAIPVNRAKFNAYQKKRFKERYHTDPEFKRKNLNTSWGWSKSHQPRKILKDIKALGLGKYAEEIAVGGLLLDLALRERGLL